jgi:hypothetical protein
MTGIEIPIAGKLEMVKIEHIDIDKLILDHENPRIGYWSDNIIRVSDKVSQGDLELALKSGAYTEYNRLKRSIESSEGIMNEIWVSSTVDGKYKIIDGNTRYLIYKDLREKYPHKDTYKKIRCKVLPPEITKEGTDFIRLIAHLRGVNDWQAYDRARILYILWQKEGYTDEQLQNLTKLSANDIRKWRDAYKNMTEQFLPKYSDKPEALNKFSYFVEFESSKIRDGMKRYGLDVNDFCEWVGNDEITKAQDVRDLKTMFESKEIVQILKDEGFQAAKYELGLVVPSYASRLFEHIEKTIAGLKSMPRSEEQEILNGQEPKKKEKILELHEEINKFIELIKKYET